VEGIQVWYRDPTSAQPEEEITAGCHWVERDGNVKKDELVLADGEFIVQVTMRGANRYQLERIAFKTNLGQEFGAGSNDTDGMSEVEIPDGHRLRSFLRPY
jgi:hypothetical protein